MHQCPLCDRFGSDKVSVVQHIRQFHLDWKNRLGYQKSDLKTSAMKRKQDVVESMSLYDPEDLGEGSESDDNFENSTRVEALLPNR